MYLQEYYKHALFLDPASCRSTYSRSLIIARQSTHAGLQLRVTRSTPRFPALQQYIDYLKDHYTKRSPLLKEKVLKVRPKEYIHLNLVSDVDEEEESDIKRECLLLQLHGDVVAIKNKRKPIKMEDIGRSEGQGILVEGCPGIGKTMFSWELCRQWAEGKMLQDRDIVVMLQLRSKRVQEANRLSDLFYHDNDRVKQEVVDYITSVEGKGVFLVLEGYDELVRGNYMGC